MEAGGVPGDDVLELADPTLSHLAFQMKDQNYVPEDAWQSDLKRRLLEAYDQQLG